MFMAILIAVVFATVVALSCSAPERPRHETSLTATPGAPAAIEFGAISLGYVYDDPRLHLTWQGIDASVDAYVVERAESGNGPWLNLGVVSLDQVIHTQRVGMELVYEDEGLEPAHRYWYRVHACNGTRVITRSQVVSGNAGNLFPFATPLPGTPTPAQYVPRTPTPITAPC